MKKGLLFCLATMLIAGSTAVAQSPQETAEITKTLPAPAQSVIQRLGELNYLPGGSWRLHTGDIAHGESPQLDDSSWQEVQPDSHAPHEAVWYRRWVEVPKSFHGYDLTGSRIWFRFRVGANGPVPQIIYFNGRRVALGDDLEPIVLLDGAKPGDRVLVAIKLMATVDEKHFEGAQMKIDFPADRPSPEDAREEFLSATALLPSVSTNLSADQSTLEKAITTVDLKALDSGDQKAFDASLRQAQSTLDALRPEMQSVTAHLTGNSHIDAAWLWQLGFRLYASSKKGFSAHQLMRTANLGSYRSAWFMAHRIREAMDGADQGPPLGGEGKIVEADETFFGVAARDVSWKYVNGVGWIRERTEKMKVLTMVERGGRSRSVRLDEITSDDIRPH